MRSRQRGITFIGWVFLLAPLALLIYACVRLTPVYLNFMKVSRAMSALTDEYKDGTSANPGAMRNSLSKHFEIDNVDYPDPKDIKIERDGKVWVVTAAFDDQAPLFSNISVHVAFEKTVRIGSEE